MLLIQFIPVEATHIPVKFIPHHVIPIPVQTNDSIESMKENSRSIESNSTLTKTKIAIATTKSS